MAWNLRRGWSMPNATDGQDQYKQSPNGTVLVYHTSTNQRGEPEKSPLGREASDEVKKEIEEARRELSCALEFFFSILLKKIGSDLSVALDRLRGGRRGKQEDKTASRFLQFLPLNQGESHR